MAYPRSTRALLHLIRGGDKDLIKSFHDADAALDAAVTVGSAHWDDGVLRFDAEARWEPKEGAGPTFRVDGSRVMRSVAPEVARAMPPELLDVTDDAASMTVNVNVRSRAEHVTWAIPFETGPASFARNKTGELSLTCRGGGHVDLGGAALGRPLESTVWDVRARTDWIGMGRATPLFYRGSVQPVLVRGRGAVAYSSAAKGLTIDAAQRLRTFAIDGRPWQGPAGPIAGFSAPLMNVAVFGGSELDASMLVAIPAGALSADPPQDELESLAGAGDLGARVVADAQGARLEGSASLEPGRYLLYARREGTLYRDASILGRLT